DPVAPGARRRGPSAGRLLAHHRPLRGEAPCLPRRRADLRAGSPHRARPAARGLVLPSRAMKMRGLLRGFGSAAALAALLAAPLAVAGCDGNPDAKVAKVAVGTMPSGASWEGVYYSELYGFLHIVPEGTTVKGKWQRPTRDRWGEIKGEITG